MRSIKVLLGSLLVSATLLLAGCGGGSVGVGLFVDASSPPPITFDVIMFANGAQVPGVEVVPGEVQTVTLPVGQNFVLDSSDPVAWTLVVGGSTVVGSGNTIVFGGATIVQTLATHFQTGASTLSSAPLLAPVELTYFATSLDDPHQVARINIILTN
jgi:hypothetical protein